jgi:hypothetical protein
LTQFISAFNDALTRRVIQLNLENHNFDGIEWSWLAFGSEGATSRPSAPIRITVSSSSRPPMPTWPP